MKKVHFVIFLSVINYAQPAEQIAKLFNPKKHNVPIPSLQKLAALKVWEAIKKPDSKGLENFAILPNGIIEKLQNPEPQGFQLRKTTLLYEAAKNGYPEVVRALIAKKVSVNTENGLRLNPLCLKIKNGDFFYQKQYGPFDLNDRNNYRRDTPLSIAFENGHLEIAADLIEAGADTSIQDYSDNTPLHLAAQLGHLQITEALIARKANLNALNCSKYTPLITATHFGHLPIVKTLITAGADTNAKGLFDNTLLHVAAKEGHLQIVKNLIARGAPINALNTFKETPLCLAAKKGHSEIVIALIAAGSNISDPKEIKQKNRLPIAFKNGHPEIAADLNKVRKHTLMQKFLINTLSDIMSYSIDMSINMLLSFYYSIR